MRVLKTAARHLEKLFAADGARQFHVSLGIALSLLAAASFYLQHDERLQGSTYDWMVKHRLHAPHSDPDLVIVDIDEKSLVQMSETFGRWPWPRDVFADVLSALESQQAQAVVFDILFSDPDRQSPEADRAFAELAAHSDTSFFPVLRLNPRNDRISKMRATDLPGLVSAEPDATTVADRTLAFAFPYFAASAAHLKLGTFNIAPDADGVVRRHLLWESVDGWRIASLPMRLGSAFGWALPDEKTHLVRWMDSPMAYKTVSFSDLYFDSQKKNKMRQPDEFKGKIVLIGSTAPGLSDLKGTSLTALHPGVAMLATVIDNLKNRQLINESPGWLRLATTVGLLMLLTGFSQRYSGWRLTFAFMVIPCMLFLLSYLSLNYFDTFIDLTTSAFYVLAYFIIAKLYAFYLMQKEKERAQVIALQSQQAVVETLRKSETELARKVDERTQELGQKNDQLNQALSELTVQKEVAESANLAKSRFLAAASHDLRQPMHTISLLVGILQGQKHYPEVNNIVGKIDASVQAMGDMFSGLLDISKFDAGAVNVHLQEFAIEVLLHRLVVNYEAQAHEKGLTLRVVPSRAWVRSDPALLERILGNLVSNAIRYTEHGSVLVGCRRCNGMLTVQVRDTGVGIAESQREQIFEEFFQIANPERDRNKGLGLGLSIVKRSALLLGHNLTLRSEVGKGSIFGIELPLLATDNLDNVSVKLGYEPAGVLAQAFVVVVEDGVESREAMAALLRQWGCHVVAAGSAREALAMLENHLRTPDLIISDYRLGNGLDGMAAIDEIRQSCEQKIPAILVTGDLATDSRQLAGKEIALLHKPVANKQLQQSAEELLSK